MAEKAQTARHILIVDDDPSQLAYMALALERASHRVRFLGDAIEALLAMERDLPALVLSDLDMPNMGGLELLTRIKERWPHVPVLLVTVEAEVATIVQAMQAGATNYLVKPVAPHVLQDAVARALARAEAPLQAGDPRPDEDTRVMPEIIGSSRAIARVRSALARAARSDVNVVITGETGTGKELVARTLHRLSALPSPFVAHNCARTELFDAEFFGHRRGAFTGAERSREGLLVEANGGILFLDEVECLSLANQAKLLRVLDDGEVRPLGGAPPRTICVRFFAATNRPPEEMIASGELREDFYYRLRGFEIALPSLNERREDIPALAAHFLRTSGKRLSASARQSLLNLSWRGNVRQLRNLLQAAQAVAPGDLIEARDIDAVRPPDSARPPPAMASAAIATASDRSSSESGVRASVPEPCSGFALLEAKRQLILRALAATGGNLGQTAIALGIHRATLRRNLRELGITRSGELPRIKGGRDRETGDSAPAEPTLVKEDQK